MLRTVSLQIRLLVWVSVVTVSIIGIIGAINIRILQQSVRETSLSQLTGITTAINARYEESHSINDVQQMFDYIQLRNAKVKELTLHGGDGIVHASTNRSLLNKPSPSYVDTTLKEGKTFVGNLPREADGPAARLTAPLLEDGEIVGVIELQLNTSSEEQLIRNQTTSAIVISVLCCAGLLLVLCFVLRKLLVKPLLTLRQAAIAIKMGERTGKLRMKSAPEITEVADAFNDMVENLDARYKELQDAQEQLVQAEKMSALGRLVAGVAHEINTPVGVGVTAASYLAQKSHDFAELFEQNRMKKSDLQNYLHTVQETVAIIQTNMGRASELIKSFKQVSVDQSNEEIRTFRLLDYIDDILRSLQPAMKKSKQRVVLFGDRELEVTTYPGAVSQIVTNLVMNSLVHAYEPDTEGYMMVRAENKDGYLIVQYADDGKGMAKEVADHIFDPFFTTNRSRGGTGLGMNIVYNLVTQKLGGTIQCSSEPGRGTTFVMEFPFRQEETHDNQSA
jgi:signal transduction histidine kinase